MSKKDDLPAMPFYIGDWKKDPGVLSLDREQKSIWFDIICLMWESKERGYLTVNGKPMTDQALSNALNLDNQRLTTTLTLFEDLGLFDRRESDGAIYSRKIIHIENIRKIRKAAGSRGGNPNLLNQKDNRKDNQNPEYENENNKNKELIKQIIDHLNLICNKEFRSNSAKTIKHINARIKEKYTLDDFKKVIEFKNKQWSNKPEMAGFLRPETLFGAKFESYIQEAKTHDKGFFE